MTSENDECREIRLPAAYIAAVYGESLPRMMALVGSGLFFICNPGFWMHSWILALIASLFIFHVISPVYTRATFSMILSQQGTTIVTGFLTSRRRTVQWAEVSAIDSKSSWAFRLLGLSRLELRQAGDSSTRFEIAAVTRSDHERIHKLWQAAQTSVAGRIEFQRSGSESQPSGSEKSLLYKASHVDLILGSVIYGQFAVAGCAALVAVFDFASQMGLSSLAYTVFSTAPLAAGLVVLVLATAGGMVSSALKYHGFAAKLGGGGGGGGELEVTYGLINRHTRLIQSNAIAGTVLRRNLVDRVLGRARLSIQSRDSSSVRDSQLALPSLPISKIRHLLSLAFGDGVAESALRHHGREQVQRSLKFYVLAGMPALGLLFFIVANGSMPTYVKISSTMLLYFAFRGVALLASARFTVYPSAGEIRVRSSFVSSRECSFQLSDVRALTAVRVLRRVVFVRLYCYAGKAQRFGFTVFDHAALALLQEKLTQTPVNQLAEPNRSRNE